MYIKLRVRRGGSIGGLVRMMLCTSMFSSNDKCESDTDTLRSGREALDKLTDEGRVVMNDDLLVAPSEDF